MSQEANINAEGKVENRGNALDEFNKKHSGNEKKNPNIVRVIENLKKAKNDRDVKVELSLKSEKGGKVHHYKPKDVLKSIRRVADYNYDMDLPKDSIEKIKEENKDKARVTFSPDRVSWKEEKGKRRSQAETEKKIRNTLNSETLEELVPYIKEDKKINTLVDKLSPYIEEEGEKASKIAVDKLEKGKDLEVAKKEAKKEKPKKPMEFLEEIEKTGISNQITTELIRKEMEKSMKGKGKSLSQAEIYSTIGSILDTNKQKIKKKTGISDQKFRKLKRKVYGCTTGEESKETQEKIESKLGLEEKYSKYADLTNLTEKAYKELQNIEEAKKEKIEEFGINVETLKDVIEATSEGKKSNLSMSEERIKKLEEKYGLSLEKIKELKQKGIKTQEIQEVLEKILKETGGEYKSLEKKMKLREEPEKVEGELPSKELIRKKLKEEKKKKEKAKEYEKQLKLLENIKMKGEEQEKLEKIKEEKENLSEPKEIEERIKYFTNLLEAKEETSKKTLPETEKLLKQSQKLEEEGKEKKAKEKKEKAKKAYAEAKISKDMEEMNIPIPANEIRKTLEKELKKLKKKSESEQKEKKTQEQIQRIKKYLNKRDRILEKRKRKR